MNSKEIENLKKLLIEIEDLPELPHVAYKILEKIDDENVSNKDLAKYIEASPALTLKILRIVNSPFFGFSHKITSLYQAIGLLGRKTVKNIAMTIFIIKRIIDKFKEENVVWESLIYSLIISRYLSRGEKDKEDIVILDILLNVPLMLIVYLKFDGLKIIGNFYSKDKYKEIVETYFESLKKKWNIDEKFIKILKEYHNYCLKKKDGNKIVYNLYCANKIANFLAVNGENIEQIIDETKEIFPYFSFDETFIAKIKEEADEIFKVFEIPVDSKFFTDIFLFFSKANKRISDLLIENERYINELNNINKLLSTALNNFPSGVIVFENEKVSLINIQAIELLDLNTNVLDLTFNEFIGKYLEKDIINENIDFIQVNTTLKNGFPVELTYLGYSYLAPRRIIFLKSLKREFELRSKYSDLKETYINILKCAGDGILITDLKLNVSFANEKFIQMISKQFGIKESILRKNFVKLLNIIEEDELKLTTELTNLTKNKINELRIEVRNKLNRIYELTCTKFIHSGTLSGIQFIIRDVTDVKKLHEEVIKNKVAVELAGATAHDLNQPLTTLILTRDLLKEKIKDKELEKYLEKIEESVNRISKIVKKLSKITKYETKQYYGNGKIISFDDD